MPKRRPAARIRRRICPVLQRHSGSISSYGSPLQPRSADLYVRPMRTARQHGGNQREAEHLPLAWPHRAAAHFVRQPTVWIFAKKDRIVTRTVP